VIRGGAIWLVIEREIRESVRRRSFWIISAILLVGSLAVVIVPAIVSDDAPERATVAVAGGPADLPAALAAAGRAQDLRVEVRRLPAGEAQRQAAGGEVDAAIVPGAGDAPVRVVVDDELSAELRAVIVQATAAARLQAALAEAGLAPERIAQVTSPPRLDVRAEGADADVEDADLGVGFTVALLLYVALLFAGTVVATGVAEEKTTRVSEVLLSRLRPSELLLGKVAGIGVTSILQLLAAALPALVAAVAVDAVDLPDATASTVGVGVLWFVAGYALYAAAYGALGALVGRQQEVGQVTAPLAMLLLVGYLAAAFGVDDPDAGWVQVASLLPPLSPSMMPMRVAADAVGAAEVALAFLLTLGVAGLLIVFGASVYRAGIVHSGPRLSLRDALRRA